MGRQEELLERIVVALEKMANDPEIEIEGGPPICPGCGILNPTVELGDEQVTGSGPLAEISIECHCLHCGSLVIAIPESYSMHRTRESAAEEIVARLATFPKGGNDENL